MIIIHMSFLTLGIICLVLLAVMILGIPLAIFGAAGETINALRKNDDERTGCLYFIIFIVVLIMGGILFSSLIS